MGGWVVDRRRIGMGWGGECGGGGGGGSGGAGLGM